MNLKTKKGLFAINILPAQTNKRVKRWRKEW